MLATLKKVVAKKRGKKEQRPPSVPYIEPDDSFDVFEFMASDEYARDFETIPWPNYKKETWPSKWHHKCDVGFCGFPNFPSREPGTFRCGHPPCDGTYTVSPELAAAAGVQWDRDETRIALNKTLNNINPTTDTLLRSSGRSAMEARARPRSPSMETIATAPVRFPKAAPPPFQPNPLHPTAKSTRRPRPSLPPGMEPVSFPQQDKGYPVARPLPPSDPSMRRAHGPRPSLPGLVELFPFQESRVDPNRRPKAPGPKPPNWI